MKQIVQTLKDGKLQILEVPPPILGQGMVLVRNRYSLISPGTEGTTVGLAKKGLIGKIQDRPKEVKQVLDLFKQQGLFQAYRAVEKKLEAYSPLGYSSAGTVIAAAEEAKDFRPGDSVACAGAGYANHAEIVAVPVNLCVKLPPGADLKKAAYNTLGAIALQGVRQADLAMGETCVVIGLGLIGQLTCLLLRAAGVRVMGIDIDSRMVDIARARCADNAWLRDDMGLEERILHSTDGVDAVIITASSKSTDPVNLAGRLLRKKGRVVIVGDVPTGFERESYYKKELELRMSCSYGPGRYDLAYEEKGIDYPFGFVRWTEKRNMQAFQEFVHSGRINPDYLTTHVFDLPDSLQAYDLILDRREPCLGILIKYEEGEKEITQTIRTGEDRSGAPVKAGFIGGGNYALSHLLPNLSKHGDVSLIGMMDALGTVSRKVADKYGFQFCTSQESEIFDNDDINTVMIATRHDSHAPYILKALKTGKNAYTEKPLCVKREELEEIRMAYSSEQARGRFPRLMVGFNRRFSRLAKILKENLGREPMAMIYRINAGKIPADSWIQDREIGGGRILGEVCHFVDFMVFLSGSRPETVYAQDMSTLGDTKDTIHISLKFENGSIGSISYLANGSKAVAKEYIEVYQTGTTGILRDFKALEIHGDGRRIRKKLAAQDKGQSLMIEEFVAAIKEGNPSPIPFEDLCHVSLTTFKILESIRTKQAVSVADRTPVS